MSFVRWGENGSAVYVFETVDGGITCCGCPLNEIAPDELFPPSWTTSSGTPFSAADPSRGQPRAAYDEMIAHLEFHLGAGHTVPGDVLPALLIARDTEGTD